MQWYLIYGILYLIFGNCPCGDIWRIFLTVAAAPRKFPPRLTCSRPEAAFHHFSPSPFLFQRLWQGLAILSTLGHSQKWQVKIECLYQGWTPHLRRLLYFSNLANSISPKLQGVFLSAWHNQHLHWCVGHTAWAPVGREGWSQGGPKGHQIEVGDRRAPKFLVDNNRSYSTF